MKGAGELKVRVNCDLYQAFQQSRQRATRAKRNRIELVGGFLDSLKKKERNVKSFLDYLVSLYR
jgi:hypothetical protein